MMYRWTQRIWASLVRNRLVDPSTIGPIQTAEATCIVQVAAAELAKAVYLSNHITFEKSVEDMVVPLITLCKLFGYDLEAIIEQIAVLTEQLRTDEVLPPAQAPTFADGLIVSTQWRMPL